MGDTAPDARRGPVDAVVAPVGWWRRAAEPVRAALPTGSPLPREEWTKRHRVVTRILWGHLPVLFVYGVVCGRGVVHTGAETSLLAGAAVLATLPTPSRRVRAGAATLGLVGSSALLVHLSGGLTEMHFHFFVVIAIVTLYQDWLVFGLAIGFAALHHGILGTIDPSAVYSDPRARADPWLFAGIHALFLLAAALANIVAWRFYEDLSLRDPLTKLANRRLFGERLEHALARRDRVGGTLTVLLIDLDQFKDVNDSQGHPAGDLLLADVARRLSDSMRVGDTLARLGGDEFAVLLAGRGGHDTATEGETVSARLLRQLVQPFDVNGEEVRVNASIGIVTVGGPTSPEDVIRHADIALYAAKASGRGRFARFEIGMADRADENHRLASDLRSALASGAIEVHYQPTVSLTDGSIGGFEALARWTHPERGPVAPEVFIRVAERTGMIVELGATVLRRACDQAAAWAHLYPGVAVSVNVAPRQLLDPALPGIVAAALEASGVDPGALTLEVTESSLMQHMDTALATLTQLQQLGVRIAIDDFGKGHSSLSYLQHLPVDVLKIDKAFIDPLPGGRGAEVAAMISTLGRLLRLDVIAEGIERREQAIALVALGCLRGQGYLYSPPVAAAETLTLLARARAERIWWVPETGDPATGSDDPATPTGDGPPPGAGAPPARGLGHPHGLTPTATARIGR